MKWPGRPSTRRPPAAEEHGSDGTGTAASAASLPPGPGPLDFRDGDAELLKRGIASQVISEHRRELRRLSGDIDRLSIATTTAGSLVEDLAADLGRELDRVRAESAAWADGRTDR